MSAVCEAEAKVNLFTNSCIPATILMRKAGMCHGTCS